MTKLFAQLCCFVSIIVSLPVLAQAPANEPAAQSPASTDAQKSEVAADSKSAPATNSGQKMVREANINLRTTVTGNQEQPRVMYILPWQSPSSPDLEMEMLSSQQDAVFGHVERDELQRSLEAVDELEE